MKLSPNLRKLTKGAKTAALNKNKNVPRQIKNMVFLFILDLSMDVFLVNEIAKVLV